MYPYLDLSSTFPDDLEVGKGTTKLGRFQPLCENIPVRPSIDLLVPTCPENWNLNDVIEKGHL